MTLADWIIVALLAGAVLGGIARGFLRSVFSLGGLLLGLVIAAWNYQHVGSWLRHAVHNEKADNALAFLLITLAVTAVASITGSLLSKAMHKIGLGCLDRLAGAVFGLFQGAVLVTVCILVTVVFFPKAQWLTESSLPKYFFGACHLSTHISPDKLAQRVRQELKALEAASPTWMHPGKSGA